CGPGRGDESPYSRPGRCPQGDVDHFDTGFPYSAVAIVSPLPMTQDGHAMARCFWCNDDPLYIAYHDTEWGVPLRDPAALFELLLLEGFQAGLSWITVLKKRQRYREVLFGFDPKRLALMSDEEIETLMQDPGIVRNLLKLKAARTNAQAW